MIKAFLVTFCIFWCGFASFAASKPNRTTVPLENNQEYVFSNPQQVIYLFNDSKQLVSIVPVGAQVEMNTRYYLNTSAKSDLENLPEYISSSLKKQSFRLSNYNRVMSLQNRETSKHLYMLLAVMVILCLAWLRYLNPSLFFSFIVPFRAYTNSLEKASYVSVLSVLLPLIIFAILAVSILSLYAGDVSVSEVFLKAMMLFGLLCAKWLLARLVNAVFGDRKFSRIYIIEFLKYGIFSGLIIFFVGLMGFLNGFFLDEVYEILLLLYLLVWFVRLLIVFYRRYKHNILYFFSYLCATEIIPILFLVYCWSIKH